MNSDIVVNRHHPQQDLTAHRLPDTSRYRYSRALELLPVPVGSVPALLDVGGGAGEFTELARERGYRTHLVDGNMSSVEQEIERGFGASLADLNRGLNGIADATFDVCSCLDVIEHIVPAEDLVSEICRVLSPGGTLILSTPNFAYVKDRARYLVGHTLKEEGYHYRFFTSVDLRRLVEGAGFVFVDSRSPANALVVRGLLSRVTRQRVQLGMFSCPRWAEAWLTPTFVWSMRRQ